MIQPYKSAPFGDLCYCYEMGIMFQTDMTQSIEYGRNYFENYKKLENTEVGIKLNNFRRDLTHKYCKTALLDFGSGSGAFVKACGITCYGHDINPYSVKWLQEQKLYVNPYQGLPEIDGWTFWDTLEHLVDPERILDRVHTGHYVFLSLPIFADLFFVRQSKHYKPNEHYYYFTAQGLIRFMSDKGFELIEMSDEESRIGRENIGTFVFQRI